MHDEIRNITTLVPNWLGDAAMCTPALRALHRRFPEAELTVAGRASVCALLEGLPWIARCVAVPSRPRPMDMLRLRGQLGAHARDLAVVFPHSFRAALLAWTIGARRRVGQVRNERSFLLTHRVEPYRENGKIMPIYMAREYLDLVACLGCADDGQGLELHADPGAVQAVRRCFKGDGPRVGIAPGAAFGPSKQWPAERFARVADALAARVGAQCVLLTGPGEEETRRAVLAAAKTPLINWGQSPVIPATAKNTQPSPVGITGDCPQLIPQLIPSIGILKAAVSQLDLLIGNDSGTRHVAVAFKAPTVCIMGSTSPRYSEGPYEKGRVVRVEVDCGPCQKPVCEEDHRCMTGIEPETVIRAALEILAPITGRP